MLARDRTDNRRRIIMTNIETTVLELIRRHTGESRITDPEIRRTIKISDPDNKKPGAGLRRIINILRSAGYPVCSDVNGYWYATDKMELSKTIEALEGRAIKIFEATAGMKKTLEKWIAEGQGQLTDELNHVHSFSGSECSECGMDIN